MARSRRDPVDGDPVDLGPLSEQVGIEQVPATVVRPLRHAVLRPGRPPEESVYLADLEPDTVHVAARVAGPGGGAGVGAGAGGRGVVLAVGTAIHEAPLWEPGAPGAWRVRGMATAGDRRGHGLGAQVLAALVAAVVEAGATLVWCNARVPARSLYAVAGFSPRGGEFDIPVIGPHVVMWRSVGVCQPIGVVAPGAPGDAR